MAALFDKNAEDPTLRVVLNRLTEPAVLPILRLWHQETLTGVDAQRENHRLVSLQRRLKRRTASGSLNSIEATRNNVMAHLRFANDVPHGLPNLRDVNRMVVVSANIAATALRIMVGPDVVDTHACRDVGRRQGAALIGALSRLMR